MHAFQNEPHIVCRSLALVSQSVQLAKRYALGGRCAGRLVTPHSPVEPGELVEGPGAQEASKWAIATRRRLS